MSNKQERSGQHELPKEKSVNRADSPGGIKLGKTNSTD